MKQHRCTITVAVKVVCLIGRSWLESKKMLKGFVFPCKKGCIYFLCGASVHVFFVRKKAHNEKSTAKKTFVFKANRENMWSQRNLIENENFSLLLNLYFCFDCKLWSDLIRTFASVCLLRKRIRASWINDKARKRETEGEKGKSIVWKMKSKEKLKHIFWEESVQEQMPVENLCFAMQ